jgi:DNA-binding beta-propeller fold protein YncE
MRLYLVRGRSLPLCAARRVAAAAIAAAAMSASAPSQALALPEAPLKETALGVVGWKVNKTTEGAFCSLVEPAEECRFGSPSEKAGGYEFPEGVAAGPGPERYMYVADKVNRRIEVFSPVGHFAFTFGWHVNKSGTNLCTAAEEEECQAGQSVAGGPAGAITQPTSVAVDRSTGDVYVLDLSEHRVEKYTASGEFLFMIGGEVNKKDKTAILCTKAEESECQSGVESPEGSTVHGWFKPVGFQGNLLAVDSAGILYVGDEGRVQEFDPAGKFVKEVAISGRVDALAVDEEGSLFLTEQAIARTIYKLDATGKPVQNGHWPLLLAPKEKETSTFGVETLTIDPAGRLAVSFIEEYRDLKGVVQRNVFGTLFTNATGEPITNFSQEPIAGTGISLVSKGIAFGTEDVTGEGLRHYPLYAVVEKQVMIIYRPVSVGEPALDGASCHEAGSVETDVRLTCELEGEANPWGVPNTTLWFEWGRTPALGEKTPKQIVCTTICPSTPVKASAAVENVRPNESALYFKMVGEDDNAKAPETFESRNPKVMSFTTPIVPPVFPSVPEASFVHGTSSVLSDEINPENAETEYFFEFAPAGGETLAELCPYGVRNAENTGECAGVGTTAARRASCREIKSTNECPYGTIGVTIEATGLQPDTVYGYRLFAEDKNAAGTEADHGIGNEGTFATPPLPPPSATTGLASDVGVSTATIAGTVNPEGAPAVYAFELGVYNGAETRYGTVSSGSLAAATTPVGESLQLIHLQPSTTYAYRITVKDAFGQATGETRTFPTAPEPEQAGPPIVEMLALPPFHFEEERPPVKCKRGYRRDKHGKCVRIRKSGHAHKSGSRRRHNQRG